MAAECACGCGLPVTQKSKYYTSRYIGGHNGRVARPARTRTGICACGCGQRTPIATKTNTRQDSYKGEPLLYCLGHNRRGAIFAPEHCEKISIAKAGVPKTKEHIEKLSQSLHRHPSLTGPRHHMWRGGVEHRRSTEDQFWARAVKRRDNYTCQTCGSQSRKGMHAHHVKAHKDFPELRYDLSNGVTLCRACHVAHHAKPTSATSRGEQTKGPSRHLSARETPNLVAAVGLRLSP